MKLRLTILLFLSIISFCSLSHAELYQWVDKDGVLHFSNVPVDLDTAKNLTKTDEIELQQKDLNSIERTKYQAAENKDHQQNQPSKKDINRTREEIEKPPKGAQGQYKWLHERYKAEQKSNQNIKKFQKSRDWNDERNKQQREIRRDNKNNYHSR